MNKPALRRSDAERLGSHETANVMQQDSQRGRRWRTGKGAQVGRHISVAVQAPAMQSAPDSCEVCCSWIILCVSSLPEVKAPNSCSYQCQTRVPMAETSGWRCVIQMIWYGAAGVKATWMSGACISLTTCFSSSCKYNRILEFSFYAVLNPTANISVPTLTNS